MLVGIGRWLIGAAGLATVAVLVITALARAQEPAPRFVPPPRTIADITAVLDLERPDPKVAARLRAEADAQPNSGMRGGELARFHYERCQARSTIGEFRKAVADCETAVQLGQATLSIQEFGRLLQGLAFQYNRMGDLKKALEVLQRLIRETEQKGGGRGYQFNANRHIGDIYIALGDFNQAEAAVRRNNVLIQEARGWKSYAGFRRASWHSDIERGSARLFEARGQFREAEAAHKRAEALRRQANALVHTYDGLLPPQDQLDHSVDLAIADQGRMKARQGRMAEGEADVRRALLSRLKATGKYNVQTTKFIGFLANLLIEQGRFGEAEQLSRAQIEINRVLGIAKDSENFASALVQLASVLNLQGRWDEAAQLYAELDDATAQWAPARREAISLNTNQIATLYNTNNLALGITAAERLLERRRERFGEQHYDTALARGVLAMGLARAGRDADAMREFKLAVPVLTAASRETDTDDASDNAAREQRTTLVIESYIALLARNSSADAPMESFRLADIVRGRSVQNALAASSARAVARNPALAELARRAQDLDKQIAAQLGALNNTLALASSQRDEAALKALQASIDKLRAARDAAKRDLGVRFREYASLIEPQPPTVDDVRKVLRQDEAFLSFYFGREASFVWAVPREGPIAFAALRAKAEDVEAKVGRLREALESDAQVVADIPPFDVALAHALYKELLGPVEQAWRPAKSLIVTANGSLGLFPLSLLPSGSQPSGGNTAEGLFAGYRNVPWLARSHAVTMVPSAASLRTLRQLPPGSAKREALIGFGDPYFSKDQVATAEPAGNAAVLELASRGIPLRRRAAVQTAGVNSADLSRLPRLLDTADELRSVALALSLDPAQVLHLGKEANERKVKGIDLSKYKVIAFATHGLVPGDLNGLTQPALALTAPDVADVDGDGLLTMEEVLALKLDADWVVLSACNTATGSSTGAEAVSGLGRAFFYAGTRTLLVTNWAVHSASARDLVADLFHRQANNPTLTRAEALRQSMVGLMDGPGFVGRDGKTLFTYAHPLFWGPYSIIGDGAGGGS